MKRIILGCCVSVFLLHSTYAQEEPTKEELNKFLEVICGDSANYAKQVMHKRQNGVTITDALKEFNKMGNPESPRNKFYKSIIYDAYKAPKIFNNQNKSAMESEYSNKVYMTCYESFSKELSD